MEHNPYMYNVCEVFYSLQGEGLRQGLPTVFIRLSGCNLRCSFCDTKNAWNKGKKTTVKQILDAVTRYDCKNVCITGGEPFCQSLSSLVTVLTKQEFRVAAETNGTVWQNIPFDWLTVSPKRAGIKLHTKGYDDRFRKKANEFKYVIVDESDFRFIDKTLKCPVILQPVNNSPDAVEMIVKYLKTQSKQNWYLRLQMHKTISIQ